MTATSQMLCVGVAGTELSVAERHALRSFAPGAVILFKRNYRDRDQLATLCAELHRACDPPPLIAVDQEGGRVIRFGPPFMQLEAARELARQHSPHEIEEMAVVMARELRAVGIAIDFAPVLDVLTNRASEVIGDRAFGSVAVRIAEYGVAFMRGLLRGGIAPCGKHFPGHGNVREDSHRVLPVSRVRRHSLTTVHLKPFVAAIAAGIPIVMLAHLMIPWLDAALPASLSPACVAMLRELGFAGVIATDDLQMEALQAIGSLADRAEAAMTGGADLVLACCPITSAEDVFTQVGRLADSPAMRARIAGSLARIAKLRDLIARLPTIAASQVLQRPRR